MPESPMRSACQGSKQFTLFFEFGIGSLYLGFIAQHFYNVYLFENEHLFLYSVWEPQSLYILSSEGGLNELGTTYMSQACISLATVI
jgi:hypothetical protein